MPRRFCVRRGRVGGRRREASRSAGRAGRGQAIAHLLYVVRSLAIAKFAKNGGAGIVVFFGLRTVGRALNAYGSALCLASAHSAREPGPASGGERGDRP